MTNYIVIVWAKEIAAPQSSHPFVYGFLARSRDDAERLAKARFMRTQTSEYEFVSVRAEPAHFDAVGSLIMA